MYVEDWKMTINYGSKEEKYICGRRRPCCRCCFSCFSCKGNRYGCLIADNKNEIAFI